MAKPVLRGMLIAALFAFVAFVLVPIYVPRPAFIPGFAPPPDMWPRLVALCGCALGVLEIVLGLLASRAPPAAQDPAQKPLLETDGAPRARLLTRFGLLVLSFALFLALVPRLGFLIASMALIAACILLTGERGHKIWIVLLSVLGPVLLFLFFHAALGTQFPRGILTKPFGF